MFSPSRFRDLASGRWGGPVAGTLRLALGFVEPWYTAAVVWRNRRYDSGRAASFRMDVPVISVGNLTLGGTGKTPMVQWIALWLRARGRRVVLISRGYGRRTGPAAAEGAAAAVNDEALELAQKLPEVPHLQNPDRVAAARQAVETLAADVILLDDAFQHRRIQRDLDIVMLDALEPFGHWHVFPRGTLREPVAGLGRAQVLALSRADLLSADARAEIRRTAARHAPAALWVETIHAPRGLLAADGARRPLESLREEKVAAFCGIGNPAGFRHTLAASGCQPIGWQEFPDHHRYTAADLRTLANWARSLGATALVATQKDLVKIGQTSLGPCPLWALEIALQFEAGQAEFEQRLAGLFVSQPDRTTP